MDVDYDSPESILEVIGRCLKVDTKLAARRPWDGFVVISGLEEGHAAHQAWTFAGDKTLPAPVSLLNPGLDTDLLERLRELTTDPRRGPWRTWIARYDDATDSFEHRFLWDGEDDGFNVLGRDTPMASVQRLNPAHGYESGQ